MTEWCEQYTCEEGDARPLSNRMASSRPGIVLLIVSFSVFAIWQALLFLDSRVFRAEVESGHFAVHRIMPSTPTPMIGEYVTTRDALDIPTKSSFVKNDIDWMGRQEYKFNERRLQVDTVCRKYRDVAWTNKLVGKEILFDIDNRLACCRHGKASVRILCIYMYYYILIFYRWGRLH